MKIPHTINMNYFKAYSPSKVAVQLVPESERVVKSEDTTWDELHPPKLTELCVAVIVANFSKRIILNELPCWDRNLLLETLPTDLPLPFVVQHINDDIYWKRKVKDKWKDDANYVQDYGFDWKRMFLERHVQQAVEKMTPEGYDLEAVHQLCDLTKDYVKRLDLRELQIGLLENEDENEDEEDEFTVLPEPKDHIDLGPIIKGLTNLTELHVQFGLRNIGSEFKKSYFEFSLQDCRNLGAGVSDATNLKLLRVHSCNLDDDRLIALLSHMEGNESLDTLDVSNCLISDAGIAAVAKYIMDRENLKVINLSNNRIGENGIASLAFALSQTHSSPIEKINLRSNTFGDAGFKFLASALVRERKLIHTLNISCCSLGRESAIFMAEVLKRNEVLRDVDLSNNCLEEEGGLALDAAMEVNKTVQYLDLRMTEIPEEVIIKVNGALHFNRIRALKGEKGIAREIKIIQKREEEAEKRRLKQLAEEEAAKVAAEEAARLAQLVKAPDPDD